MQNSHVTLYLQEKAQNKQKREQLEHLWKDMGSVCVQGNTLAGTLLGRLSLLQLSEDSALRSHIVLFCLHSKSVKAASC